MDMQVLSVVDFSVLGAAALALCVLGVCICCNSKTLCFKHSSNMQNKAVHAFADAIIIVEDHPVNQVHQVHQVHQEAQHSGPEDLSSTKVYT